MKSLYYEFLGTKEFMTLTDGQKAFFEKVFSGKNVLLTGAAGTGKSFCLKTLFDFSNNKSFKIAKTASTGVAAVTIGGSTIHSFAGLGLADKPADHLITDIKRNKKAVARISSVKTLFIDEISMISSGLLDKIDIIFKYFRYNNKPFGGVQMIFCGDFCQLPPVSKGFANERADFAFEARSWKDAQIEVCLLTEIKRQNNNDIFATTLNQIRLGDSQNLQVILDRDADFFSNDIIKPIKLSPLNRNVDLVNQAQFDLLKGTVFHFDAIESGEARHLENLERNCLAPRRLYLKIGAQVLLLSNIDTENGWVNGLICKVIKIENNKPVIQRQDGGTCIVEQVEWPIKETIILPNGDVEYKVVASRKQIPLKLGYAITIHKSQSLTLDKVEIDFTGAFDYGQVYVALSRAKSLSGLVVKNLDRSMIKANPKCVAFYSSSSS